MAQTVHEEKVYGRQAWVLENGTIRVALLRGGGHIAEVRLLSTDPKKSVNPMRVPHYATIEPYQYRDARDNPIYGEGPHRWLSAGYMGHLLCFPSYGPPSSDDEVKAGLGSHGEAPIVEWKKLGGDQTADAVTFRYGARLEKTQYLVERAVTLRKGARSVRVEEWVENLTNWDRPANWMEHATFGQPFIEPGKTFLDVSATRGLLDDAEINWADGKRRMMPETPHTGSYTALLMDPARHEQFFTLYHTDFRVLIGYVFPAAGSPWIADWQENRRISEKPWNGQAVARGIEFGDTPFAEGLRKSVERGSLFGQPSYRWINAHARLKREYTIFLEEIPEGFTGVRDVTMNNGTPAITNR
jgi:hypothetical protein